MLRMLAQNIGATYFKSAKRMLFAIAAITLFTTIVVAECERRGIYLGTRDYAGREYSEWISCGSSAGNFGYICNSDGNCYFSENLTADANSYCGCSDEVMPVQNAR